MIGKGYIWMDFFLVITFLCCDYITLNDLKNLYQIICSEQITLNDLNNAKFIIAIIAFGSFFG